MKEDPEIEAFYAKHAAGGPANVVIAHCYGEEGEVHGVFSSLANARRWADSLGENVCTIFSPYIVDLPEYGNVPGNLRN